jgi:hypothetical protein
MAIVPFELPPVYSKAENPVQDYVYLYGDKTYSTIYPLPSFDNIKMDLRTGPEKRALLIASISLGSGIATVATNGLFYNFGVIDDLEPGTYWTDIKFISGTGTAAIPNTFLTRRHIIVNQITE